MSSFLALFCCCSRDPETLRTDEIDERSHLIPSNIDSPPSPSVEYTDHQRLQERLVTIVRAKERKMVNVTSQIPFNLHNRVLTPHPSVSRSLSLSTGRPEPIIPFDIREPLTVQLTSGPSTAFDRARARHSDSNSHSHSHSHSREASLAHPSPPREPILNVRLVNPQVGVGGSQRVGRPRHRAGSSSRNTAMDTLSSAGSVSSHSPPDIKPLDEICWSWGDTDP
ncbi:hypothetical protein C8F01DRAFT_1242326 [Mycena amicta]|nr:hypothetical protein C8F01DRAFT_1242326 [Mycena amicta]